MVYIWTQQSSRAPWTKAALEPASTANPSAGGTPAGDGKFADVVWRVSWSVSGNVLAVSSGAQPLLATSLHHEADFSPATCRRRKGDAVEGEPQGQV